MRNTFSWLDVKLGIRMLLKYPGLTLVGGLGLMAGVAVAVAFFAVLTAYVYPTLPLDEGDRVVALENRHVERNNEDRQVLHDFATWRHEVRTITDLGAFRTDERNLIGREGPPEAVDVAEMTASGFRLARVPARLGRHLIEEDEAPGALPVVVIGYDVWQARFGGDPGIVGREIRFGATPHTVVGVMPEGFAFPQHHQYWTPLKVDLAAHPRGRGPSLYVFGRLAPGATMAQVLAGRALEAADADSQAGGVVVNRAFVQQVLGGGGAVGRRVRHVDPSEAEGERSPERWFPIVGVFENLVANRLWPDTIRPVLYYAVAPEQVRSAQLAVRTRGPLPDGLGTRIRELAVAVDPTLRLSSVRSLADADRQEQMATRLVALGVSTVLLTVFLLSAAGVYALMSVAVTRQRREIGIRMALGAEARQILHSVFARAGRQILLGVALGLAAVTLLDLLGEGMLLVGRGEILIPAFAVMMAVVAALAALGPARRAMRIQPTEALRAEA